MWNIYALKKLIYVAQLAVYILFHCISKFIICIIPVLLAMGDQSAKRFVLHTMKQGNNFQNTYKSTTLEL